MEAGSHILFGESFDLCRPSCLRSEKTGTPLWRNGPPDKPVFCNACGLIWRIKGTLVNYMRAHRREDTGAGEAGPDKLKLKGQK